MKYRKFSLAMAFLAVLIFAVGLAGCVEQRAVAGQSSTRSPDGNWCLHLRLTEYSNIFTSHKILDANLEHSSNSKWNVNTSVTQNATAILAK